ncbi:MAG: hypothetical protein AB1797_07750 [bacterium]
MANRELRIADWGLRIGDGESRIANRELGIANWGLRIGDCGLGIADGGFKIFNPKSEIRNPQSIKVGDEKCLATTPYNHF